jgi:hypothetical protein
MTNIQSARMSKKRKLLNRSKLGSAARTKCWIQHYENMDDNAKIELDREIALFINGFPDDEIDGPEANDGSISDSSVEFEVGQHDEVVSENQRSGAAQQDEPGSSLCFEIGQPEDGKHSLFVEFLRSLNRKTDNDDNMNTDEEASSTNNTEVDSNSLSEKEEQENLDEFELDVMDFIDNKSNEREISPNIVLDTIDNNMCKEREEVCTANTTFQFTHESASRLPSISPTFPPSAKPTPMIDRKSGDSVEGHKSDNNNNSANQDPIPFVLQNLNITRNLYDLNCKVTYAEVDWLYKNWITSFALKIPLHIFEFSSSAKILTYGHSLAKTDTTLKEFISTLAKSNAILPFVIRDDWGALAVYHKTFEIEIFFRTTTGSLNLLYEEYASKLTHILKTYQEEFEAMDQKRNYFRKKKNAFKCKMWKKNDNPIAMQIFQIRNFITAGMFADVIKFDINGLLKIVRDTINDATNKANV